MWHHITRTFISSAVFSVTWFSFLINVLYRSEGWCQKFLPELSSTSLTGLCSALTLFKGCTSSLLSSLGKTPRNCSRWWNASLLMSAEFNQQKASLAWCEVCMFSPPFQNKECIIFWGYHENLRFREDLWNAPNLCTLFLLSHPCKFLCLIHHIQGGTVILCSHPLSKFFIHNVLGPLSFVMIPSCWVNNIQAVYHIPFVSFSSIEGIQDKHFYFIGSSHIVFDQEISGLIFHWHSSSHVNGLSPKLTNSCQLY